MLIESKLNSKKNRLEEFELIQKWEEEYSYQKSVKEHNERLLKKNREIRRKKFLELAYDGDLEELESLVQEFQNDLKENGNQKGKRLNLIEKEQALKGFIDSKDSNGYSALSEAAAGNNIDAVRFLLAHNSDVNSKGGYNRTPLWRSAFQGHIKCVKILLENGADPRIYAEDGSRAVDWATGKAVDFLKNWDLELTLQMLQKIKEEKIESKRKQIDDLNERQNYAKSKLFEVKTEFEKVKAALKVSKHELDELCAKSQFNSAVYSSLIEEKRHEIDDLETRFEILRDESIKSRIIFKDLLNEFKEEKKDMKMLSKDDEIDYDFNDHENIFEDDQIATIHFKKLELFLRNESNDIFKNLTDKCALLIDPTEIGTNFLRYSNTNYLNGFDVKSLKPEPLRKAIIGSIRYGKPLVFDIMQYDEEILQSLKFAIDQVKTGLFNALINKSIIEDEKYMDLVIPEIDGDEYDWKFFTKCSFFKLIFVTSNPYPCDELMNIAMPIRIISHS